VNDRADQCYCARYEGTAANQMGTRSEMVTLILSYLPVPAKASVKAAPSADSVESEDARSAQAEPTYIDAQNSFGNTALHWACLGGHLDIVKLLLSRGASPAIANDKDQIPLDLAAFNNHMDVVEYFLSQSRDMEGDNAEGGSLAREAQDLDMRDDANDEAAKQSETGG
jgi:hypothetical protein